MEASIHLDMLIPEFGFHRRAQETEEIWCASFPSEALERIPAPGEVPGQTRNDTCSGLPSPQGKKIAAPRGRRALGGLLFPPERS